MVFFFYFPERNFPKEISNHKKDYRQLIIYSLVLTANTKLKMSSKYLMHDVPQVSMSKRRQRYWNPAKKTTNLRSARRERPNKTDDLSEKCTKQNRQQRPRGWSGKEGWNFLFRKREKKLHFSFRWHWIFVLFL